jgi:hypothetical protein
MQGILDRVAAQWHSDFHPKTTTEYLALRLAQKLGEAEAAPHYLALIGQHGEELALAAYRHASGCIGQPGDLPRKFHWALRHRDGDNTVSRSDRLLAIKVERRSVAFAFFVGTQLDYTQLHHLPSARNKAEASISGFVNSMIGRLKVKSAALEQLASKTANQRSIVSGLVEAALTSHDLPIAKVEKNTLLASYGNPTPKSRDEVRKTVCTIWPVLGPDVGILDAVALGLYVQTERLFGTDQ